jgi:hypothetical protein
LYGVRCEVLRLLWRRILPYWILNIGPTRRRVPQDGNIVKKNCSALNSRDSCTLAEVPLKSACHKCLKAHDIVYVRTNQAVFYHNRRGRPCNDLVR